VACPELPQAIRAGILAMVKAVVDQANGACPPTVSSATSVPFLEPIVDKRPRYLAPSIDSTNFALTC